MFVRTMANHNLVNAVTYKPIKSHIVIYIFGGFVKKVEQKLDSANILCPTSIHTMGTCEMW